jgi:hypothetical protein
MQQSHQSNRHRRNQRQTQTDSSGVCLRLVQPRRNLIARIHAEKFSHLPRRVNGTVGGQKLNAKG